MDRIEINQLVHGYQHGHELLAGSATLPDEDAQLVRRLSDLSGILPSNPDFKPYLTFYPLTSSRYFVVAKTWLDEEAVRSGCVITLSLLLQDEQWANMRNPVQLSDLLKRPVRSKLTVYKSPTTLLETVDNQSDLSFHSKNSLDFVAKFFADNIKPIVWFDEPEADHASWLLLRALWPKARTQFSLCTYALQPRNLKAKPFDLMFAPSSVYSRFHKFGREHFVNARSSRTVQDKDEPWFDTWIEDLFEARNNFVGAPEWCDLPEDTSAISKLFLARQLLNKTPDTPMAGLGLLDLLEAMSPAEPFAYQTWKTEVVNKILESVREEHPDDESIRLLYLTAERVSHKAFACVSQTVRDLLLAKIAHYTELHPTAALDLAQDSLLAGKISLFAEGVVRGMNRVCRDEVGARTILQKHQDLIAGLITRDAELAKHLFAAIQASSTDLINDFVIALSRVDNRTRYSLLLQLLPQVRVESHARVLEELLGGITESDLTELFSVLIQNDSIPRLQSLRQVLQTRVAQTFPALTRAQYKRRESSLHDWTFLYAATFGTDLSALNEVLTVPSEDTTFKAQVVADLILLSAAPGLTAKDRQEILLSMPKLIDVLISASTISDLISDAIYVLLRQVPDLPLAKSTLLRDRIETIAQVPIIVTLIEAAMVNSITEYIKGAISLESSLSWDQMDIGMDWLMHVGQSALSRIVHQFCSWDMGCWNRAWSWLLYQPSSVYQRSNLVAGYVASLLSCDQWNSEGVQLWCQLLARAQRENPRTHLELCFQGLSFAMAHKSLALSTVVVETFYPVYECVISGRSGSLREAEGFFGFFSWDKGKELRERLIETYRKSEWPPGDLALAVRDADLLRKVLQRMSRTWSGGSHYLDLMEKDLRSRNTMSSPVLLQVISRWTNEHMEEWD